MLAAAVAAGPAIVWATAASTPPAEVSAALPGALLQGQGRLRYFGVHIYDAVLWSPTRVSSSNAANSLLALEMRYARALSGELIAERSLREMQQVGDVAAADGQRWLEAMKGIFPDVKSGDRITGLHRPGQGAAFFVNGRAAGDVRDALFAELFFGVWLSPRTSQPALRAALMGAQP